MNQLIDQLETEWELLVPSRRARQALAAWADDPALWGFADLHALVAHVHRRGHPIESDRVLAALARRAAYDDLAARTILQAMLPGLKSLMRSYRRAGPPDEVEAMVVAAAFARIRNYPCERRPARTAANILADTRQTIYRTVMRDAASRAVIGVPEPLDDKMAAEPTTSAADELVDLVGEAVRTGRLSRDGARVVLLTRVGDHTIAELAAAAGEDPRTLRQRRRRAEAQLAAAVAVA